MHECCGIGWHNGLWDLLINVLKTRAGVRIFPDIQETVKKIVFLQQVSRFGVGCLLPGVEGAVESVLTKTVKKTLGTVIESEDITAWRHDPAGSRALWLWCMSCGHWQRQEPFVRIRSGPAGGAIACQRKILFWLEPANRV